MKSVILTIMSTAAFFSVAMAQNLPDYKNESLSFEQRAMDLVSRMTLEEKAAQMCNDAPAIERLDIPEYNWWNECLHGLARAGRATVFPQAIGLAATFDTELIFDITDAISDEARAFYNIATERNNRRIYTGLTFYSPNVNIFRDPRWGRGQETYGEDPYLTSQIGVAFVKGLQGSDPKYMKAAACAKHYAVHSGPEELRHEFDAVASPRDLHETYFPAFKALVQEGGVESVMGAYNRVNGQAACASKWLLTDVLREDWGFDGYVTSDCGAIVDIFRYHKLVPTAEEAAALAVKSGLNLNCGSVYRDNIPRAVGMGLVDEECVDSLLYKLILTRFKLGLFDNPDKVAYNKVDKNIVDSQEHIDLAYRAAVESVVLLENKGNALPLKGDENMIFVTGPFANNPDALIGNYYGASSRYTTFLEGICEVADPGVTIEYRQGVMINEANKNPIDWATGEARNANATIAYLGLTILLEGEEGESLASEQKGDMIDNSLPAHQIEYLRKLKSMQKNGQPLIAVICAGCPVNLNEVSEIADAVIYAWYPGEAGGKAVADIIFGKVSPSGRTPITFVKDVDKLPAFDDYSMIGRTYRYMIDTDNILYPFGYGLSYAAFEYSDLDMPSVLKAGEQLKIKVTITNSSQIEAQEVVQIYVSDVEASVETPIRRLAAIQRVNLKGGESKVVELSVAPEAFSLITDNVERKIEAGDFIISVGGGQPINVTNSFLSKQLKIKRGTTLRL
ncbi:MAG: glycoside hydrolase family 3 N-terminal domain-containing protein [Rikenellaceae bacterium]